MAAQITLPPVLIRPADPMLALKVGDELWREPLDMKMDKNKPFTFDVALQKPGVIECEPALKTLQDMANLVGDIVTNLGRFLP